MKILIAGATGSLGSHLTRQAKENGHWVRILSRNPKPEIPADDSFFGDLTKPYSIKGVCNDIDAIISAAGASLDFSFKLFSKSYRDVDFLGNKNLLEEAKRSGTNHFLYVSVFHKPQNRNLAYVKAHYDFETKLMDSGLRYAVIRPTGYFSAYKTVYEIARKRFIPLIGDGSARTNPIAEQDLAAFTLSKLNNKNGIYDIGGPVIYSRKRIFELAASVHHKKPSFFKVPPFLPEFNQKMLHPFDPRLSDLLEFLISANMEDYVAPRKGKKALEDYFREL